MRTSPDCSRRGAGPCHGQGVGIFGAKMPPP
uniref:Uncharacterized protein n=1 Tax=Siphoviridae sp. ctobd83 TaxID=2825670 RepID=A0A8S5P050_9CAUD|nr:MAG TPA: hypothetical protein [Siphoviridae sp. ctobd83]